MPLSNITQLLYKVLLYVYKSTTSFTHPLSWLWKSYFMKTVAGTNWRSTRVWGTPVISVVLSSQRRETSEGTNYQNMNRWIRHRNVCCRQLFNNRYDGSVTCVSPHSRTKATWGDTSWQSMKEPPTTVTSALHSLETMEHFADIFSQNTRESGEKLIWTSCHSFNQCTMR